MSTPTLTGPGERSHLATPQIGLEDHVKDVAYALTYEDRRDVVLVGHSSSGAVITGAADRVPERVAHLVYLDAFVPEDGQSVFDLILPETAAQPRGLTGVLSAGDRLCSAGIHRSFRV